MNEELIQLIETANVPFPKSGSGVLKDSIDAAQRSLGLRLPASYRAWLTVYGGGQLGGDIVYGLDIDAVGLPDIVELARLNQRNGLYDPNQLVFCVGNGEDFFFDTNELDDDGEYRVCRHDVSTGGFAFYAASFGEFLEKRIRELYRV